ncbi:hypothetical protein J6590_088705 [Homalodisca vitripennis]|nr:hypothetical protein J6590_088705 [Homalodisca vitripennis]
MTSEPPPMAGQADCLHLSAVTHPSSSHARCCFIQLSRDNHHTQLPMSSGKCWSFRRLCGRPFKLAISGLFNKFKSEARPSLQRCADRINSIGQDLCLVTPEGSRKIQNAMFLYKILNALIDCPQLLERIDFKMPLKTRSQELFVRLQMYRLFRQNSQILSML